MKQFNIFTKAFFVLLTLISSICANAQQLAFPGAEGFGRFAIGGRSGDVYHVTNLLDNGDGSLRYGIDGATGPRTIVFDISGNILLKKRLLVNKPFLTIAGQTAPGEGITLYGGTLNIQADHIIVRYIRVRLGDTNGFEDDAVTITRGSNIILDHISASWSVDETLSCQSKSVDSITVQWSIISESLRKSIHEKGAHGYGGIIGATRQSFHHNLYTHHSSRSPKVTGRRHCEVDFRNNVIYNWGFNSCYDGTASYMNWVNNYYKPGPATLPKVQHRIFELSDQTIAAEKNNSPEDSNNYETSLYAYGNFVEGFPDVTKNNWNGGIDFMNGASETKNRVLKPAFEAPAISEQSAQEAYLLVLEGSGASIKRDSIDSRIIREVTLGIYTYGDKGMIDSQENVGGLPVIQSVKGLIDSDRDGIPDDWEKENGLNPYDPRDSNKISEEEGYTNLENYLNEIIKR